jgi:PHP family Zn ribbon phosphoesterase
MLNRLVIVGSAPQTHKIRDSLAKTGKTVKNQSRPAVKSSGEKPPTNDKKALPNDIHPTGL